MSVGRGYDFDTTVNGPYSEGRCIQMQLRLLAEIVDALARMEQQRLAEFEFYKSVVKMMKQWDTEGLPVERNV